MKCKRCKKPLSGNQTSYCSGYCSKLHLKAEYRKRKREEINAYNRAYRSANYIPGGKAIKTKPIKDKCRKCGATKKLTINHIIPRAAGGTDDPSNLEVLCGRCNTQEFHAIVKKALVFYFANQK